MDIFLSCGFIFLSLLIKDAVSSQVLEFSTQGFPDCNTVNLDWNAPEEGSVDTYHLSYSGQRKYRDETGSQLIMTDGPHVTAVSGQSTFLVLRPLHAAMKYSLNVTATFQDGTNSQPARLNIRMPVDVPPEFPSPVVHKVTDGHVVLRLHRTSEIVGKIKSYWLILAEEQFVVNQYPGNMTIQQLEETPGIDVIENFGKNLPKHLTIGETVLQEHRSHYHLNTTLEISRYYRAFVRAYTGKYKWTDTVYSPWISPAVDYHHITMEITTENPTSNSQRHFTTIQTLFLTSLIGLIILFSL